MPELNPPDEARTKALVQAMVLCFAGYTPVEAASAVAAITILITRGEMGDDATTALVHMLGAEAALMRGDEPCPN